MNVDLNSTEVSLIVQIVDDEGLPVTGLSETTFPSVYVLRSSSSVELTLSDLDAIDDDHSNGGLGELSGGRYRLDLDDSLFETPGVLSIVAEESDLRLLHPQVMVGLLNTGAGNGPNNIVITVNDGTDTLEGAVVRLRKSVIDDYEATTNSSGEAEFDVPSGTYRVSIALGGHEFTPADLVVSADGSATYSMTATVPGSATDASRCRVSTHVYRNGVADAGAKFEARLIGSNNAVDGIVVVESASDLTDSDGLAELDLIRADQFVGGPGKYKFTVTDSTGKVRFQIESTIPNTPSAVLEDLVST